MKINIKDQDKFAAALNKRQARTSVRELTRGEVLDELQQAEQLLQVLLLKKDWQGTRVTVTVATRVAASYKEGPQSTFVTMQRFSSGWFVTEIYRANSVVRDDGVYRQIDIPEKSALTLVRSVKQSWMF